MRLHVRGEGHGSGGQRDDLFLRERGDGDRLVKNIPVQIDYTNWRGERKWRSVVPVQVWHGSTPHHPDLQWFLNAYDTEKEQLRDFALVDIHAFAKMEGT